MGKSTIQKILDDQAEIVPVLVRAQISLTSVSMISVYSVVKNLRNGTLKIVTPKQLFSANLKVVIPVKTRIQYFFLIPLLFCMSGISMKDGSLIPIYREIQ
jgi:hypothetical protein